MLMAMGEDGFTIRACPAALRPAALRTISASLTYDGKTALAGALRQALDQPSPNWEGLLVAESPTGEVAAAIWVQPYPGKVAMVWPPDTRQASAESLLRAAAATAARHDWRVAQMLIGPDDAIDTNLLQRAGFPFLADLRYMAASARRTARIRSSRELRFAAALPGEQELLEQVLERTYEGTRDCPRLDQVRSLDDVLEGYRNQGTYLPEQWYLVRAGAAAIGVLLLAAHPGASHWELMYMGVVPAARGRGYGEAMARHARLAAATGGARRVVLAVDATNHFARKVYARAGFAEWDRRVVHAYLKGAEAS
jgi:ribosomal protein S18 acetylase RimI-like enzyme